MKQASEKQQILQYSSTKPIPEEENIFFSLIERVGSMGRYQIFTYLIWCLVCAITGGFMLITPFIFFQNSYQCQISSLPPGMTCKNFVCSLPSSQRQAYIPDSTILSLANKFEDYRCNSTVSLMETLMYGGTLLAIILLALLGGILGKRTLIFYNLIIMLIGTLITAFSVNLVMGGIGMFLCTFGGMVNLNICYAFIIETVCQKYRRSFAMTMPAVYSLGSLGNVLWFYIFPNFQTVLIFFYAIPLAISLTALIVFVKDEPISLIVRCQPKQAQQKLKFIAKINKKSDFAMTVEQMAQIQESYKRHLLQSMQQKQSEKKFNVLDLFKYKSLRKMSLILAFIDCTATLEYFTPSLMINQFNFNIYINGLVVQSAQLISGIISCFLINCVPRRVLAIVTFSIILVCSTILIFVWDQNQKQVSSIGDNIAVLVLIFVIEFAISSEFNFFVIYINELYPTQVRIISVGFIKTFGSTILLVSSEIIDACLDSGFRIMILFSILAALSIVCSYVLPETHEKIPPDIIQELKHHAMSEHQTQLDEIG